MLDRLLPHVDRLAHALHLPKPVLARVCDAYDRSLGVYDDDQWGPPECVAPSGRSA